MRRGGRDKLLLTVLGGVLLGATLGAIATNPYYVRLLTLAAINVILAVSINLLVGYAGQVSLAHAAFYGTGAYVSALLTTKVGVPFWIALPVAALFSAGAGVLLGLPTLRLKGHYLAIATLGFGIVVNTLLLNWVDVTGGPMGVLGIPSPSLFGLDLGQGTRYLVFSTVMATLVVVLVMAILDSPWGRAFVAIREDEISAIVSGVDVYKYKITAFALASGFAGLAGSLYAHYVGFISPEGFDLAGSIEILITAIAGGLATMPGPIFGAVGLMFLSEALRETRELRMILYGALLIVTILFLPQGGYPALRQLLLGRSAGIPGSAGTVGFGGATTPYVRANFWRAIRSFLARQEMGR